MTPDDLPFDAKPETAKACPICGRPATPASAPFCSRRCVDIDLHRWLGGVYAVPADEPGVPGDDEGE